MHGINFTLYGADFKGAQRERRANDPHVMFDPPQPPFILMEIQKQLLLQCTADVNEQEDFLGVRKYTRVMDFMLNIVQAH